MGFSHYRESPLTDDEGRRRIFTLRFSRLIRLKVARKRDGSFVTGTTIGWSRFVTHCVPNRFRVFFFLFYFYLSLLRSKRSYGSLIRDISAPFYYIVIVELSR